VEAIFLPDAAAAGQWLKQNLREGDAVLVKGSRGVHLEQTIEILNPSSKSTEIH
jgi:UDP-N-acetylmuramoyl-tripeptide--D-alanyl-D-alanine ligase